MKKEHPHILITGLVYPGFLGAFLVEMAQNFTDFSIMQGLLVVALIFHYSGDFLYTVDREGKQNYNSIRMLLDIVLVVLLFLALRYALHPNSVNNVSCIWKYLALFKLICVFWEFAGKADKYRTEAVIIDTFFLGIYAVGWQLAPSIILSLTIITFIDASAYFWWQPLASTIHNKLK
jgi:hypothetical protein